MRDSVHPRVRGARDLGRVAGDLPIERAQLVLEGTPEQQASLEKLLRDQHDPSSPNYHRWLTPQEFGERFSPAQADVDAITAWLTSHGAKVEHIANGRRSIEFSGTAGQVEELFQTEIHSFESQGEIHVANATDVALPSAVAAVSPGLVSLHNFQLKAKYHRKSAALASSAQEMPANLTSPEFNSSAGSHYLSPYDFATIYNVLPLWNTLHVDGTGQSIAISSRSNINLADVTKFRAKFGLPGNNTEIILNGNDPGIVSSTGDDVESDLDAEWAGAIAKGATIKLVVSKSTNASDGIDLSSGYAVDNNVAPVLSLSYGDCEARLGSFSSFYNSLWQQAAAQGISVIVAAGDSGSAVCDDPSSRNPARRGFAVDGLASTPYGVAVGGTQFNDTPSLSKYWAPTNDASTLASALGYIPEATWNESAYGGALNSVNNLYAGGGGVSSIYATPSWQVAPGVPTVDPGTTSQHHRYLPDISLAAAEHNGFLIMNNGAQFIVSGTSAGAPTFAGIVAMLNQYTGMPQGNPNPRLYAMANSVPQAFHDILTGNNAVPCSTGTSGCTGPAFTASVATMGGYSAGPGYDLATGLGSVDAYNLVTNWQAATTPFHVSQVAPHIVSGGGWETIINLVNPAATPSQVHLRMFSDSGAPLTLPLTSTDGSIETTTSALDPVLPPRAELVLHSTGPVNITSLDGSVQMSSDGNATGFIIFRWTLTGEEVLVPLQSANAQFYTLAFDNTDGLATGLALSNSAAQSVDVTVTVLDQNGAQITQSTIALPARGHKSFVLTDPLPASANQYGSITLAAPQGSQINATAIRANASGAFTGIPMLANLSTGSGTAAHVTSGGGWETLVQLVNLTQNNATAHLQFYADGGGPLALPLVSKDGSINITASSIDPVLGPGSSTIIRSTGDPNSAALTGSAELTSSGAITGSLIFRFVPTGQEVLVPLESSQTNMRLLSFDNTNGTATGIAVTNRSNQIAVIPVIIRDQTGAQIGNDSIALSAQGHASFVATDRFHSTANRYGTIEFDTPSGGQISVVGIRGTPTGAFTGIPVIAP
ncbi:MAG: S53 family peptidase [Bryobacteraceae bacterium]